jgi:hypothetical protein
MQNIYRHGVFSLIIKSVRQMIGLLRIGGKKGKGSECGGDQMD